MMRVVIIVVVVVIIIIVIVIIYAAARRRPRARMPARGAAARWYGVRHGAGAHVPALSARAISGTAVAGDAAVAGVVAAAVVVEVFVFGRGGGAEVAARVGRRRGWRHDRGLVGVLVCQGRPLGDPHLPQSCVCVCVGVYIYKI